MFCFFFDVRIVPSARVFAEFHLTEDLLMKLPFLSDSFGMSADFVAEVRHPVGFCEVEHCPASSALLCVFLDVAEIIVVFDHNESHCVCHGVAEALLLAWGVVLVGPVVYLWESAGESIILVLVFGLCVSPEMDSGVVVWLSVLSVMMLLISLFLSSDLALGRGVLVRGWLWWIGAVVLLWIGLIRDDLRLFPGE